MIVQLHDQAENDLADGYEFYEQQEVGLGLQFIKAILAELRKLETMAGIHPIYHPPYHQMFIRRFPYAVYYSIKGETVVVDALIDCRRDPESISRRLN